MAHSSTACVLPASPPRGAWTSPPEGLLTFEGKVYVLMAANKLNNFSVPTALLVHRCSQKGSGCFLIPKTGIVRLIDKVTNTHQDTETLSAGWVVHDGLLPPQACCPSKSSCGMPPGTECLPAATTTSYFISTIVTAEFGHAH